MCKAAVHLLVSFSLTAGFMTFTPVLSAGAQTPVQPAAGSLSPEGLLNPDGTLRLTGRESGPLDLEGWEVKLDPRRGPVFAPPASPDAGNWTDTGGGMGALNGAVYAMAVLGGNLYVGGDFFDVDNIPEADYVAGWNGSNWFALGHNGLGDGAVNSSVISMTVNGPNLVVGGWFNNVNNNGTYMAEADYIASWNGSNWSALGSNGAGNGALSQAVYALAADGTNVYAGGAFTDVNNGGTVLNEADYVAKWNGSAWSALGSNGASNGSLNSYVTSLAVMGTEVFAGGSFTDVNNGGVLLGEADYIAKWNGSGWSALGSDGAGGGSLNGAVYALAISGPNLYVGGTFVNVDDGGLSNSAADWIARWDGSNWFALGSGNGGDGALNNVVYDIKVNGSDVYAGGYFTDTENGMTVLGAADYVAKWNGSAWSALGGNGSGNGSLGPYVEALALSGSSLYVAGGFSGVNHNGTPIHNAMYIAEYDGTDWSAMGSLQGAFTKGVTTVTLSGTDVYVGGYFTNLVDQGVPIPEADYIARWDGSNWHAVGSNGFGNGALNSGVFEIVVDGTDVYAGGGFSGFHDSSGIWHPEGAAIAKFDGTTWTSLGGGGPGLPSIYGSVHAIAVSGSNVYAGGWFTNVQNGLTSINEADYIARWDGTDWHAVGSNGAGNGSLNNGVLALEVLGSDLYVGGMFTNVNNGGSPLNAADHVAKWNGSGWSALGADGTGDGSLNDSVASLEVIGSDVYVGGWFSNVENGSTTVNAADFIARWDGVNWSAVGSGVSGNGALTSAVYAMSAHGSNLYAAGYFQDIFNAGVLIPEGDLVAKWDGTDWSALGSNGAGDGAIGDSPASPYIEGLAADGDHVYVGGYFYNVNNNGTVLPFADNFADFQIQDAAIDVTIGGLSLDQYLVDPTSTVYDSYPALIDGPVNVLTGGSDPFLTSQRASSGASYNELMGVPPAQFTTKYWFPFYDHGYPSVPGNNMRTWILVGNPDDTLTAEVNIYIGGSLMGSYSIPPGGNITPRWIGLVDGPVLVVSNIPAFVSERVFTAPNNSFNEVMGYPANQFTSEYWFPWYDNVNMNASILVGNATQSGAAAVDIYIGSSLMGSYSIAANETLIQTYPSTINGPVRVVVTNGLEVVASEAALSGPPGNFTAYNEVMGYPFDQFDTEYWFPWYDHGYPGVGGSNMRTWILVGNPSGVTTASVDIYIDGTLMGTYAIPPGSRITPRWIGLQDGPVQVLSDIPVFASERVFTAPSNVFNEMMGYPFANLTTEYWFAWYDSVNMTNDILIARP